MITDTLPQATDWSTPAKAGWVVRERVVYERVALMFRGTPTPLLLGAAYGGVVAAVLLPVASTAAVAGWYAALLLLTLLRLWQLRRFAHDRQRHARPERWQRHYLLLLVPYGLLWSLLVVGFASGRSGFGLAFLLASLLGVLSVGIYTTHSVFAASVAWVTGLVGPLLGWVLWTALQGSPEMLALGVGALAFAGAILTEAWRSNRVQTEMLRLRLENAAIADERQQALLQAEQSSRAKTRFLATISHEMRTPLNGIVGISELLRDESSDPLVRERAAVVLGSAEQLNRVIGELLDLSRLEFGRLQIEPGPLDPEMLLGEVLAIVRPLAAERGLALEQRIEPGVPRRVSGDAMRIKQVLHAMLAHALAHGEDGRLAVGLAPTTRGLRIELELAGAGLPAAALDSIFEPFERAEAGADDRHGTGLGLALARRLARAMHGDLVAAPLGEAGPGCRFEFSFAAPALAEPLAVPPPTQPLPCYAGQVLVVDDNEVNALVAEAMLRRLGLAVRCVRDGDEALDALTAQGPSRPVVVLMDCRMPRLDGWEATRQWRAHESGAATPRLPIIGVTANVSDDDRRRCTEAGMDGFLAKPFRIQELVAVLKPHLDAKPGTTGR